MRGLHASLFRGHTKNPIPTNTTQYQPIHPIPPNTPNTTQYHPNTSNAEKQKILKNWVYWDGIGMILVGIWCIGWYWVFSVTLKTQYHPIPSQYHPNTPNTTQYHPNTIPIHPIPYQNYKFLGLMTKYQFFTFKYII